MNNRLDPLAASDQIRSAYHRYVKTFVDVRDPELRDAFRYAVDHGGKLIKGPLLEATPAYAPGASLRELIQSGVLETNFAAFDSENLPLDRPLYRHQEEAIRKVVNGRNVVVTTGTGSGKTESFLIPILNHLAKERSSGTLGPGVRALLLYPMNALANDQVKRLRGLLRYQPDITFGRYTGETKEDERAAENQFRALNPDVAHLPNELISRQVMRERPPNILLTNYAMLEYLLLRPLDMELFASPHWKFLALDEAHVYDGAKGAEIAMLLRRLRDRVQSDTSLQCIATSASLDGTRSTVMKFATSLFGTDFVWNDDATGQQDMVTATRVSNPDVGKWGPLSEREVAEISDSAEVSAAVLKAAHLHGFQTSSPAEALHHERAIVLLRQRLARGPLSVNELARSLWPDAQSPKRALEQLVNVAGAVTDGAGNPVLSARYHLFVRATEGAFTCLSDEGPHVQLGRHQQCPDCDASCFEFGACQRCGAVYLAGQVEHDGKKLFYRPSSRADGATTWLIMGENDEVFDEDDETLDTSTTGASSTTARLCAHCGLLNGASASNCGNCGSLSVRPVRRYDRPKTAMASCSRCGARAYQVVRRLNMGADAPPSVLTTALYQQIPAASGLAADHRGEGRKLLLFSDSRQAAAFAAPYLQNTYGRLQERRLIVQGLDRASEQGNETGYRDLLFHTLAAATDAGFFGSDQTHSEREREVALWLMLELVSTDHRQSLEGLGMLAVTHQASTVPPPRALIQMGLTSQETWDVLDELVRVVRQQGVLSMPAGVAANDDRFQPRLGPIFMRSIGSEAKRKVLSWSPTRGTNRRIDYLRRVLAELGSDADAAQLLERAWTFVDGLGRFVTVNDKVAGAVKQIDHNSLRFQPGARRIWHQCSLCRRISPTSVRGVCPNLGCEGELQSFQLPDSRSDDQHYRRLYRTLNPVPMSSMEHTAQWTSEKAASIQQDFVDGKVNVLSCSTTFELGVDVGDLQSVVMRNMPPTTANYVQRSGRAGRRADSAALVLTFAQRRSHDLSRFQTPEKMIAGHMRVPIVPLENERIARRHAHSVALASFFRHHYLADGSRWSQAGQFFIPKAGETIAPADWVGAYLTPVPQEITNSLRRVLPQSVQHEIGVATGQWVVDLVDLLRKVSHDINYDVREFSEKQREAADAERYWQAKQMKETIRTVVERDLLGYLGNRNILPKYGFPVDTVELRTMHSGETAGRQLELSRDLSQAIYDYAPGNQVIAGGRRWTSAGIHRLPGRELITKQYQICTHCGHYVEGVLPEDICPACTESWTNSPREYLIPEFGFVAESQPTDVGTAPPERSWHGATYVQSLGAEITQQTWQAPSGHSVAARSGARGRLVAISEGIGGGFLLCGWCGWGRPIDGKKTPMKHFRPMNGKECTGPLSRKSLGHSYETDMVELVFPGLSGVLLDDADWRSVLYAVVEGGCQMLEISRDDLDGSLYWTEQGSRAIVLFDTVPGGAGGARMIAESLEKVIQGAIDRVQNCECGEETSCYACLRGYRNARFHDELSRRGALRLLNLLRPGYTQKPAGHESLDPDWQTLVDYSLSDNERRLLLALAGAGVPLPEQGYESEQGIPLALAWPQLKIAVVDEPVEPAAGWQLIGIEPGEVDELVAVLKARLTQFQGYTS